MAKCEQFGVKDLQRRCFRALQLQTDLAEASCEMLLHFDVGGLSAQDRRKLTLMRRQEKAAADAYLRARKDLIEALSHTTPPADRRVCRVVSVTT